MLKNIGVVIIVLGAILIWQIPLLGWFVGGMLVFIGISLIAISRTRKVIKTFLPSSVKVCPDCKSPIPGDAKVCLHCGYRYTAEVPGQAG